MPQLSALDSQRLQYLPKYPKILEKISACTLIPVGSSKAPSEEIQKLFPNTCKLPKLKIAEADNLPNNKPIKVGVVLSGGQAPGGHNVICGIYDALMKMHPDSSLIGFLDGPKGIIENKTIELTANLLAPYRNQGGFDLIGAGRTKIETEEQFESAAATASAQKLDGIVIIGGDDSNTNAALLAEYFIKKKISTSVIGVPKTIDGDLKNEDIEISFGFDTASKTYSANIGSVLRDCLSAH